VAGLASGSTFAMTFMLALDLLESKERSVMEFVMNKARESGTPFLSLFSPDEMIAMAEEAGFKKSEYVSAQDIFQRYFASRPDGLNAGNAEAFLVAAT
jgi:O-methyltransferase involved in polyketide biosynthesis